MKVDILTIFPDFFRGPLDYGIVRRAREAGLVDVEINDLRAFAHDRHRTVDDRELSIGDYVLSGGELGAAVILDTMTRLIPGALGNEASSQQESFTAQADFQAADGPTSTCASGGLLDYPHYTRPADFRGMTVPEVLVSGNHEDIRRWRRRTALEKTVRNRPDLLQQIVLSDEDKELLAQITGKDL